MKALALAAVAFAPSTFARPSASPSPQQPMHFYRGGCSPENLASTWGAGFVYCFAID